MIADLKPYAEYRASRSPWLGNIPVHWKLPRLGSVLCERKETNEKRQIEQVLSVMKRIGVIRYEDKGNIGNKKSEDTGRYKIVRPDDIVVNCMNVIIGSVGRSQYTGCLSPVYYVLTRRDETNNPRYMAAVFATKSFHESLVRIGNGILAHRMRIPMELLKCEPFPVPPPVEQDSIVRFLSWANGRLDRAIRAKRKVITLLNEQKQAIIHRAVTRGLDPSVPLKPSGIPWLGDIPQSNKRTKLGRICISVRDGTHNPPPALPGIHRLLSVRNIVNGKFVVRDDDRTMLPSAFAELQRSYTVERGDVVVAIVGATTGKSAVVGDMQNVTVQRSLAILRPNPTIIDGDYLGLLISSQIIQRQIKQIMDKYAAQPGIYLNELSGLQALYPSLRDQASIVSFVQASTEPLVTAINRIEREIDLLREYRTRLVADVVTGKLDVREAAAKLPAEEQANELGEELVEDNSEMIEDEITEPVG